MSSLLLDTEALIWWDEILRQRGVCEGNRDQVGHREAAHDAVRQKLSLKAASGSCEKFAMYDAPVTDARV